ncbi:hypothetical protein CsSME_00003510 [Camellia sinensis var. sinensis]
MSSISRRKANSLGGYWRVWELWVYTCFTSLAPVPVRPIELSVPHSQYYNYQFERCHRVDRDFPYFHHFFDMITMDQLTGILGRACSRCRGQPMSLHGMPPPCRFYSRAPLAGLTTWRRDSSARLEVPLLLLSFLVFP